jgi:hypothetical protein
MSMSHASGNSIIWEIVSSHVGQFVVLFLQIYYLGGQFLDFCRKLF